MIPPCRCVTRRSGLPKALRTTDQLSLILAFLQLVELLQMLRRSRDWSPGCINQLRLSLRRRARRLTELNNPAIRNQPRDPHIVSKREYRFKRAFTDEKGMVMTGNMHRTTKKVVLAVALAAGFVGLARAEDSSMNPFIGDSYSYFNGGDLPQQSNRAYDNSPSAWRQQHPDGMSVREMQSRWGAWGEMFHLNPTVISTASADPSFKQSHPHGLTEPEFQALSSEAPAWQGQSATGARAVAVANQGAVTQSAANEPLGRGDTSFVSVARSVGAQ
jgi:hypothetical protein